MGTGYTRNDTANNIADGNVINAADLDGEFDAIESSFNSSTGHTHDGTSAEGAPIEVVGPTQDVVITASAMRPKTDNTVDLGTSALMYKDGFFDGTVTMHSLVVFDDEATDATIKLDGNYPDGSSNVALGLAALDSLDSSSPGGSNTAIGSSALTALTTAANNTAIGKDAGSLITTGAANTIIGQFDGNQGTLETLDIRTSSNHIVLSDGAGEPRIVVDNSGRVLVGNTSAIQIGGGQHVFQVGNTDAHSFSALRYNNGTGGSRITLGHSRSATVGTVGTAVADNDNLGQIDFAGDDGSDVVTVGARIKVEVDGTPSSNNMPSAFSFLTFEDGGSLTERMRITNTGKISVGLDSATTLDDELLSVLNDILIVTQVSSPNNTAGGSIHLGATGTSGASHQVEIKSHRGADAATGELSFSVGNGTSITERMRIDSSGRVLIGTSSSRETAAGERALQVEGTTGVTSSMSITRNVNGTGGPNLTLAKTRGTSVGDSTIVASGDTVGSIIFSAADGTDANSRLAEIEAFVDGTPGANDTPGRLVFSTTADGAATTTERMRIDSSGQVGINTSSPIATLHISDIGSTHPAILIEGGGGTEGDITVPHDENMQIGHWNSTTDTFTSRIHVDTNGNVGLGVDSSLGGELHVKGTDAGTKILLESTSDSAGDGPILDLYRNSATPDDNDNIAIIYFSGENDADEKLQYARIDSFIEDASDGTEDGRVTFQVISGGSNRQFLGLRSDTGGANGEVVINESQHDIDFRIESDSATNLFVADASTHRIGIGTSTPSALLHVTSGTSGDAIVLIEADTDNNDEDDTPILRLSQDGGATITDIGLVGSAGTYFTNSEANATYLNATGNTSIQFATNDIARVKIKNTTGFVGIGTEDRAVDEKLHLEHNVSGEDVAVKIQNIHASSGANATLMLQANGNNFSIINFPDADTSNANRTSLETTAGSGYFTFDIAGDDDSAAAACFREGINGFGTDDPSSFMPSNISGGRGLVNTGSGGGTFIAARNDNTIAAGNVIGSYLLRSNDSSGVKFGGMVGTADDSAGSFHLQFFAGRSSSDDAGAEGALQIQDTNDIKIPNGSLHVGRSDGGVFASIEDNVAVYYDNTNTYVRIQIRAPGSGGDDIFRHQDSGNVKSEIESNGDFLSATNSYGAISDQRLKENIVDASSQWDDIKALQFKKYSMIEDELDAPNMLGVIAQDLQASGMNGLVKTNIIKDDEDNPILDDDGNEQNFLSVKYSVLYMKAIKALQEAMTKIESLETENTAIKARLDALET